MTAVPTVTVVLFLRSKKFLSDIILTRSLRFLRWIAATFFVINTLAVSLERDEIPMYLSGLSLSESDTISPFRSFVPPPPPPSPNLSVTWGPDRKSGGGGGGGGGLGGLWRSPYAPSEGVNACHTSVKGPEASMHHRRDREGSLIYILLMACYT